MIDAPAPPDAPSPSGAPPPFRFPAPERPAAPGSERVRAYAVAVLAVGAALAVTLVLRAYLDPQYFFVFLAAVMVAAWSGGLRPGLLATALAVAAAHFFFLEPRLSFAFGGPGVLVKLAVFAALGGMVSLLCQRMRRARRDAEEQAGENARMALLLQEQAVELEQQAEEAQSLNEELEEQVEESAALRVEVEGAAERLRAASAAAEADRARLERVLETMVEGVLLVDADGRITFANAAAARILSAPREALAGARYDDPRYRPARPDGTPMPPDEAPVARVLATGEPVHAQEVDMRVDGQRALLRVSAAPLRGPDGAVTGAVVSFDDVTADREAEEALRESEARFRALADSAPVLIWMAGPDAGRDYFNRPWIEFTGRALEEELGNGWAEGVHPDDYQRCVTIYFSSFEARRPFRMEYRLRRHGGEHRWLLDHGVPRFTPDGRFQGFIGTCVDITERREAEEQQRFLADATTILASSLQYEDTLRQVCRLAVPAMADFCIIDLLEDDGRARRVAAVHADPAAEPLMAVLRDRPPDLSPASRHPVGEVLRTGVPKMVNDITPADITTTVRDEEHQRAVERLRPAAWMMVPLVARGRILGAISFTTTEPGRRYDAAELARAEELARRAAFAIDNARLYERAVEANRAKSDFLAVMSHELRTPLNAIIGYTDLFLYGVPAPLPDPMRPQMVRVQSAARHLLELIEEILTFARLEAGQEEAHLNSVSASDVVQEAASLVEPLALERGIAFRVEGPDPDFALVTDARKVRQILVNLLGNAVKFTEAGEARLRAFRDGAHAVFVVSDTGIGIWPDQIERIFEPFWQADQGLMRAHGGSGLGLSVARQLARLLGGDITARSTPGEGSTFTLRLPVESA